MTGTQLYNFVKFLLTETTASFFDSTRMGEVLNYSLYKWAMRVQNSSNNFYLQSGSLTLTAAANYVALPSDCTGRVYYILDNALSYQPLKKILFNRINFDTTYNADPDSFCLANGKVYFNYRPAAAKTYTIYYMRTPTTIATNGSTEIDFPPMHHDLIGYEAAVIASLRDNKDISQLMALKKEAEASLLDSLGDQVIGLPDKITSAWPTYFDGE